MTRLKIAIRNVFRNRSRTLLSIGMISGAIAGIILFRGFAADNLYQLKEATVIGEMGHIQVAKKSLWDFSEKERVHQLATDLEGMRRKILSVDSVSEAAARLSSFGLISQGDRTMGAKAVGVEPDREKMMVSRLQIVEGQNLVAGQKDIVVGIGLFKKLQVPVGTEVTVIAYTLDGAINAMDFTIRGVFVTGVGEFDSMVFFVPLPELQKLMAFDGYENMVVRLDAESKIKSALADIKAKISEDPKMDARPWYDLSEFYKQVEQFYTVQNTVIACILITLVLLGILNTVGLSVYERTGEIGTVRALGETPKSIMNQFLLEACVLAFFGLLLGFSMAVGLANLINSLGITMDLPAASGNVPIRIALVPRAFFEGASIAFFTTLIATAIPSRRASRIPIVEALRKNV